MYEEHSEPSEKPNNFVKGEFKYIKEKGSRDILIDAYKAINLTETWEYIKDAETLMFSNDPRLNAIKDKMGKTYFNHSGASFSWTMRVMQYIALNGEETFMKLYLS